MEEHLDTRWTMEGITEAFLLEKAEWLRAPRSLHGRSLHFFELAGTLVRHSVSDYPLASLAFFQSIIGLESALRIHYQTEEARLADLMARSLKEKILQDSVFSAIAPFSEPLSRSVGPRPATHSETLVALVPALRNQFFHGVYLLAPDYIHFTVQMRELADVLDTNKAPRWRKSSLRGLFRKFTPNAPP